MDPTTEQIDELYREEVLRARGMPLAEKFLAGPRLFDYACAVTAAGIRHQYPQANERQVLQILRQRLELARRLQERP
jgi:hypothetical protein